MAYILIILLAILTIYLYSKNDNKSHHDCGDCKGCNKC